MNKLQVLVTGAAGFLGRYCARQLSRGGVRVIGLGRGSFSDYRAFGVDRWWEGSVDAVGLARVIAEEGPPAVIVHCAGSGSVQRSFLDPAGDFSDNVLSLVAVLEAARILREQPRVVMISSAAVYGRSGGGPMLESFPLAPMSPYGRHKQAAEVVAESYRQAFSVPLTVVRMFSVYGEGLRKQIFWDACARLTRGDFCFSGSGDEVRDWIHVEDAARIIAWAATDSAADGMVINGGSGKGTRVADALAVLGRCWDPPMIPSFDGSGRRGDPDVMQADIRLLSGTGFVPTIFIDEGLARYVAWFRSVI